MGGDGLGGLAEAGDDEEESDDDRNDRFFAIGPEQKDETGDEADEANRVGGDSGPS